MNFEALVLTVVLDVRLSEVEVLFDFFRNKIPSLGLAALFVLFFLSGCRAGIINVESYKPSNPNVILLPPSTTSSLSASSGHGSNASVKMSYSVNFIGGGSSSGTNLVVAPGSAEVLHNAH